METEVEKEVEWEIPRRTPGREQDWDCASIFRMRAASEVAGSVKLPDVFVEHFT
jgi:hypothetical protein